MAVVSRLDQISDLLPPLLQILDSMAHVENEAEGQLIGALWAIMASDSQQRGLGAITPADVITEILTSHPWWTERPDYAMHAYAEILCGTLEYSITASRLSVRSGTACTPSARICALNGTPSGASDERPPTRLPVRGDGAHGLRRRVPEPVDSDETQASGLKRTSMPKWRSLP